MWLTDTTPVSERPRHRGLIFFTRDRAPGRLHAFRITVQLAVYCRCYLFYSPPSPISNRDSRFCPLEHSRLCDFPTLQRIKGRSSYFKGIVLLILIRHEPHGIPVLIRPSWMERRNWKPRYCSLGSWFCSSLLGLDLWSLILKFLLGDSLICEVIGWKKCNYSCGKIREINCW